MEQFIKDFLDLVDNGSEKARADYLSSLEKEQLYDIIKYAIDNKSLAWKNRMLLQMVQYSPFSFWACDNQYIIKLWEAASTEIYKKDYLGKEFWHFVEKKERAKALEDCLTIISEPEGRVEIFDNYYAIEEGNIGILTQSISLYDDINNEHLQGEIGLKIDLAHVQKQHEAIIKARSEVVAQFEEECDKLLIEFQKNKEELYSEIKLHNNVSERGKLREECSKTFNFFCKQLEQLRQNAIKLETSILDDLRNQFLAAMEQIEAQINQPAISKIDNVASERAAAIKQAQIILEELSESIKTKMSKYQELINGTKNPSQLSGLKAKRRELVEKLEDINDKFNGIIKQLESADTVASTDSYKIKLTNAETEIEAEIKEYNV